MPARTFSPSEIDRLKREAKKLAKRDGISHTKALDTLAAREGFDSWWHLQHDVKVNPPDSGMKVRGVVRFVMDRKDTGDIDDERLEERGFVRDDEFAEKVAEWWSPSEPWDAYVDVLRFINPPDNLAAVIARVQQAFFFAPDEIYFDDQLVPDSAWNRIPGHVIIRDPPTVDPAKRIVEGLLRGIKDAISDSPKVAAAAAQARAEEFVYDSEKAKTAELDGEDRIRFTAVVQLVDTEFADDPEFGGEKIDVSVSGVAVKNDGVWKIPEPIIDGAALKS